MKYLCLLALALVVLTGCSPVENAAEEGKNAFQAGMHSSEKAREFGAQKEAYDKQSEDF